MSEEQKLVVLEGGRQYYRCKRCRDKPPKYGFFEEPLRNRVRQPKTGKIVWVFACPLCHVILPVENVVGDEGTK